MGVVALVVVENEVEELELTAVLRSDTPVKKCAEWIALHEAVEQPTNLLWLPHELPLDRGQHQIVSVDFVKGLFDGMARLVHRDSPDFLFSFATADGEVKSQFKGSVRIDGC